MRFWRWVLLMAVVWSGDPTSQAADPEAPSDPSAAPGTSQAGQAAHAATELNNQGVVSAQAGRFEEGVALVRKAHQLNPADELIRQNLSKMLTDWALRLEREGHVDEAIGALREAVALDQDNGRALVQLGDLTYLKQNDLEAAIRYWQRAHGKVPPEVWPAIAQRISRTQRDQLIERGFVAIQTPHFRILVQDQRHPTLEALGVLLEEEYAKLNAEQWSGPDQVTVIIYTGRDLQRVYNQRDWAMGFYDGRIRLSLDDVGSAQQRSLVAHELAHAFLHHHYGTRLPVWVQEGYAQTWEGEHPRSPEELGMEERLKARTAWVPLAWLDRHFTQPSSLEDVQRAYVQARLVVGELLTRYRRDRFTQFLSLLAQGLEVDAAYDQAFAPSRWTRANQGIFE